MTQIKHLNWGADNQPYLLLFFIVLIQGSGEQIIYHILMNILIRNSASNCMYDLFTLFAAFI